MVAALLAGAEARLRVAPTAEAAFPGTNGRFAFSNMVNNQPHIFTSAKDGSDVKDVGAGYLPVWSPDGTEIAYADTSTSHGVGIMDADGQNRQLVVPTTTSPNGVHWSPDGSRLVYANTEGGQSYLAVADRTGANEQVLGSVSLTEGQYLFPRWAPDGSYIAFAFPEETSPGVFEPDIWLIKPDGSDLHRLTNFPNGASAYYLDWSPDASELVVTLSKAGGSGLFAVDRNGVLDTIQLTNGGPSSPAWSPDGERVAYLFGPLSIVNRDGSGSVTLTVGGISNYGLDWQPIPQVAVEFTQGIQELQAVSVLKADLAGDGAPPVPLVAGKPAAMRVYFNDVEATTVYEVEATGDVNGSRFVELTPGCTAAQRRSGENGCQSLDFSFTPPEGDWSTTLKIRRQQDSQVLEEHEFNLTSVETVPLILKPVTVCDRVDPNTGVWTCGSLFDFVNLLPFLRAIFPGEVSVAGSSATIYVDTGEVPPDADWWEVVTDHVKALWTADGAFNNVYEYGVVRPQADAGTTGGLAYDTANASAGRTSLLRDDLDGGLPQETAHELIAHLLGLNMGLERVPSSGGCYGQPAEPDANWPNGSSPQIGETGFDVAEDEPVPDTSADVMSLCTPRWISPYTYNNIIDKFRLLTAAAATAGLAQGDFWLVSGLHDKVTGDTEFDPLFQLETEGSDEPGTGDYSIEVRDTGGGVLFTRLFNVDTVRREDEGAEQPADATVGRFAELVPIQAGAAKIVVLSGTDEVGEIVLGGATPVVQLTSGITSATLPAGAPPLPVFSWSVEDGDSAQHSFWLELSKDSGATWTTIAPRYAVNALTVDPALVGGGAGLLLRIRASDGVNTGIAVSEPFNLQLQAPQGAITAPSSGSGFDPSDLVWLQAGVVDAEDGFLDGASVQWSSSRDGSLGTGASLPVYDLGSGSHTITMTAQDSDGHDLADSITITVSGGPAGDPHLWGDNDCDGEITSRDNQALSRKILAQAPLSQTQPCPGLGDVVTVSGIGDKQWGDLDCDGEITSRDNQAMLRKVLQQAALSQTQPCPVLGDAVTTVSANAAGGTRWRRADGWSGGLESIRVD